MSVRTLAFGPRGRLREIAAVVALAALVGFAVYQVHMFWSNGFDDAFITYRYADNLRAGNGLVFNPGERVEGTSTFLFTIMLSGVMAFGAEPHLWARIFGGASFCMLVVVTYALGRHLFPGPGRRTAVTGRDGAGRCRDAARLLLDQWSGDGSLRVPAHVGCRAADQEDARMGVPLGIGGPGTARGNGIRRALHRDRVGLRSRQRAFSRSGQPPRGLVISSDYWRSSARC